MRRLFCILLVALLVFGLCACSNQEEIVPGPYEYPDVAGDPRLVFEDFCAQIEHSFALGIDLYAHYNDEKIKEAAVTSRLDYMLGVKILEWEQITEDLYAAMIEGQSIRYDFHKTRTLYYVGRFNGRWYVMRNHTHIPEELTKGVDLDKYILKWVECEKETYKVFCEVKNVTPMENYDPFKWME